MSVTKPPLSGGPADAAKSGTADAAIRAPSPFEIATPPVGCSPEIVSLFDYWRAIHPPEGLPGRRHFDPRQVPRLLPHLWMLDISRQPWRFRVRLVGTAIVEFLGHNGTGKWMHDLYADFETTEVFQCLRACARDGRPAYLESNALANRQKSYVMAERLILPLAADGRIPDMLLLITLFRR